MLIAGETGTVIVKKDETVKEPVREPEKEPAKETSKGRKKTAE